MVDEPVGRSLLVIRCMQIVREPGCTQNTHPTKGGEPLQANPLWRMPVRWGYTEMNGLVVKQFADGGTGGNILEVAASTARFPMVGDGGIGF